MREGGRERRSEKRDREGGKSEAGRVGGGGGRYEREGRKEREIYGGREGGMIGKKKVGDTIIHTLKAT